MRFVCQLTLPLDSSVKENVDTSLLASALELMAEHVHLISVDYMSALMKSLRHLLQREDLSRVMRAHCLKAVNAMLSGEGAALNVDPQEFFRQARFLARMMAISHCFHPHLWKRSSICSGMSQLSQRREKFYWS